MTNGNRQLADGESHGGEIPPGRKKRRWLFRICVAVLLLAVGLFLWWYWLNESADRELRRQMEQYHAAGEPVYPRDFDSPPVADEDNAAIPLKQAFDALELTQAQKNLLGYANRELIAEDPAVFQRIVQANGQTLRLIRQARSCKEADWGIRPRTPMTMTSSLAPRLTDHRTAAQLLNLAITCEHRAGDDAQVAETLRDMLALGRHGRKLSFLTGHLMAIAIDGMTLTLIEDISPGIKVEASLQAAPASSPAAGPATAPQVRELIRQLMEEDDIRRSLQWAFYADRAAMFDTCQEFFSGRLSLAPYGSASGASSLLGSLGLTVLAPATKGDFLWMVRSITAQARAAEQPTWPAAKAKLPDVEKAMAEDSTFAGRIRHPLRSAFMPSFNRVAEMHFRSLAKRRMAATALAIRLWEVDHGRRPDTLQQLVPDYLPAVPQDPFAADGRALAYRPDADPPVLYSLGPNGTDEGGKDQDKDDYDWRRCDVPFYLNGRPAASTAPSQYEMEALREAHRALRTVIEQFSFQSSQPAE